VERGSDEELVAEFSALSAKVSDKQATDAERARWRELRTRLASPQQPPRGAPPSTPVRKHARVVRKLRFAFAPSNQMRVAFAEEVGAGGLKLTMNEHVEVGTQLVLRLELAGPLDADPLLVLAKVAWVKRDGNHFGVGLEFVSLKPEDRERVEAWAHSPSEP